MPNTVTVRDRAKPKTFAVGDILVRAGAEEYPYMIVIVGERLNLISLTDGLCYSPNGYESFDPILSRGWEKVNGTVIIET